MEKIYDLRFHVASGRTTRKRLGLAICDLVSSAGAFTPFFAQEQK